MIRFTRQSPPSMGVGIDWADGLAQGLVGCWPLSEGAGQPNDAATGVRGATFSATWAATPYGAGLSFNGTNQWADLGNNPAWSIAGPLTMACLCRPATGAQQAMMEFRSPTNAGGFTFAATSGNLLQLTTANGTAHPVTSSASAIDGGWHLFGVSLNSTATGGAAFYRDGAPWGTATNSFPSAFGSGRSGTNPNNTTNWFNGPMAMALLWNRGLSATEHAALALNPWQVFAPHILWAAPAAGPSFAPWIFGDQIESGAMG